MADSSTPPVPKAPEAVPAAGTGPGPGTVMYDDPKLAPACAASTDAKSADAPPPPMTGPAEVPVNERANPVERKMRGAWSAEPERARLKILLHVPAERAFRALVEPADLEKWFCREAAVEKKKGGRYAVGWTPGKKADWTIEEYAEGSRLVVSRPEKMDFTLSAEGAAATLLDVSAELPSDLELSAAEQVLWSVHLLYLKAYLENGLDLREADRSRTWKDGYVNGAEPA